ncbi:MAG: A24 family peptidase [Lentisphaerae bacterium]|nr:A24 family peptidase [Lentisphaerota bacterium]
MDTMLTASLVVLALLLSVAVYTELTAARIPNWLTLVGLTFGLLFGALPGGLTLESSFMGLLTGFGVLFIFYVFGGMGGGDVKLMGAVGSLIGYPMIISALVYTAIIGGVMALSLVASRGVTGLCRWARAGGGAGGAAAAQTPAPPARLTVPYALAIASGTLLVFYFGSR